MKLGRSISQLIGLATFALAAMVFSAPDSAGQTTPKHKVYFEVYPRQGADMNEILRQSEDSSGLRVWQYAVQSTRKHDKKTYIGVMVGDNPLVTNSTTTITVFVQPVILQIGSRTFDPTAADPCIANKVPLTVVKNSPMVKSSHDFKINGVDMGATQYSDAFQRANFWTTVSVLGGTYHVKLRYKYLSPITLPADPGSSHLYDSGNPCSPKYGGVEVSYFKLIEEAFLPLLSVEGVKPSNLALFLLQNTVLYKGTPDQCCIGGFHSSAGSQTYGTVDFDTAGFVAPDTAIMSHEILEWLDDPFGNNPTPAWGHVGQQSGCQKNLEVGDPLSGTNYPAVTMSGFKYHLQELAFFSWFYGPPSIAAGGLYSDNGTFTSTQPVCH